MPAIKVGRFTPLKLSKWGGCLSMSQLSHNFHYVSLFLALQSWHFKSLAYSTKVNSAKAHSNHLHAMGCALKPNYLTERVQAPCLYILYQTQLVI